MPNPLRRGEELDMIEVSTGSRQLRKVRAFVLAPAVALALLAPAAPAGADNCKPTTNAIGIANSTGAATVAATVACAPAYGEPAGVVTGRKTG
jgi:hypothetical protein